MKSTFILFAPIRKEYQISMAEGELLLNYQMKITCNKSNHVIINHPTCFTFSKVHSP